MISENLENTRRENSVCFTIPRIRNAAHIPQDSNKHKKYILAIYPYYMYCIIYATIELEYWTRYKAEPEQTIILFNFNYFPIKIFIKATSKPYLLLYQQIFRRRGLVQNIIKNRFDLFSFVWTNFLEGFFSSNLKFATLIEILSLNK